MSVDPGKAKKIKTAHQPAPEVNLKSKTDLRRECTYEVFAYEIWPKVSKKTNVIFFSYFLLTELIAHIVLECNSYTNDIFLSNIS